MFSNCLFCSAALGQNESVEHMPVGSRLAFDAHRGRLWVVCRICGRWNLCPFDQRWEALEECEKLVESSLLMESSPEITLLRAPSGVRLIRIGRPPLGELLSWRFARSLIRRRRAYAVGATALIAASGGVALGSVLLGGTGFLVLNSMLVVRSYVDLLRTVVQVEASDGRLLRLTKGGVRATYFTMSEGEPALQLWQKGHRTTVIAGAEIPPFLAKAMPVLNHSGASMEEALAAARLIDDCGGPEGLLVKAMREGAEAMFPSHPRFEASGGTLRDLPEVERIAIEAASHVEQEDRVLSGVSRGLLHEWKRAESEAEISDSLLDPTGWDDFRGRHQSGGPDGEGV